MLAAQIWILIAPGVAPFAFFLPHPPWQQGPGAFQRRSKTKAEGKKKKKKISLRCHSAKVLEGEKRQRGECTQTAVATKEQAETLPHLPTPCI